MVGDGRGFCLEKSCLGRMNLFGVVGFLVGMGVGAWDWEMVY